VRFQHDRASRPLPRARWIMTLALAAAAVLLAASPSRGAETLADVDLTLVVEVREVGSWLALHEEVLATSREAPKPLTAAVPAATGGRRAVMIIKPHFDTQIFLHEGAKSLKVIVAGKVPGGEALASLTLFEAAVLAIQAGAIENEVVLSYGLAVVEAELLEVHLSRR
jgi:hypothetical protein